MLINELQVPSQLKAEVALLRQVKFQDARLHSIIFKSIFWIKALGQIDRDNLQL